MFRSIRRLLLLLLVLAGGLLFDGYQQLHAPLRIDGGQTIEITPGDTLSRVIAKLDARHWLPSTRAAIYLKTCARWHGLGGRIRSGDSGSHARPNVIIAVGLFLSGGRTTGRPGKR